MSFAWVKQRSLDLSIRSKSLVWRMFKLGFRWHQDLGCLCIRKVNYPFTYPQLSRLCKHSVAHLQQTSKNFHVSYSLDCGVYTPFSIYIVYLLLLLLFAIFIFSEEGLQSYFFYLCQSYSMILVCKMVSQWWNLWNIIDTEIKIIETLLLRTWVLKRIMSPAWNA